MTDKEVKAHLIDALAALEMDTFIAIQMITPYGDGTIWIDLIDRRKSGSARYRRVTIASPSPLTIAHTLKERLNTLR